MIKKIYDILDRIRSFFIITILSSIIVLSTIQIVFRYFTFLGLRPFPWGDELIRLSSIWVAFLAASIGAKEEAHLSVTIIIKKYLSSRVFIIFQKIANVVVIGTLCYLIYFGFLRTIANFQTSLQNINISIAWFYAAIPVGCTYLAIDYLLILIYGKHPFSNKMLEENFKIKSENVQ